MPIEDALTLITRNFDTYMRGEQTGSGTQSTGINSLSDRHPEAIQVSKNFVFTIGMLLKRVFTTKID